MAQMVVGKLIVTQDQKKGFEITASEDKLKIKSSSKTSDSVTIDTSGNVQTKNLTAVGITVDGKVGVGTSSPQNPLDIYSMGGLTIAETYIHATDANVYHDLTTSYQTFNNHQVTFTAPANGKVKVKFIAMFTGLDSSVGSNATGEEIYARIYDSGNTSYITDVSGVVWDGNKFMQTDESGNHMQVIEANVDSLTAGTSYTYQFSFKKGANDTNTRITFGAEFPPVIIRAETLGNVTSHTS